MTAYFFDASAFVKRYHAEPGSNVVESIFDTAKGRIAVSKLGIVEASSSFARRLRTGTITRNEFMSVCRRIDSDVISKQFRVVRVTVPHFNFAERLIRRIAPVRGLRSLDSLQLAVALSFQNPANPVTFVCSDLALCAIAASEGLAVLNPETDPAP